MTECFDGRSGRGGAQAMMWAHTRVGAALEVLAIKGRRSRERSARSAGKTTRTRTRTRMKSGERAREER